jgi:Glyoxalase/Bleomycin resistance protein/Dioxygenase superfamily
VATTSHLRLYHTGIIVDDLDEAMGSMGSALALHWAPPKRAKGPMLGPEGVREREVVFTYSVEGPHHIELLQQIEAGPYLGLTGGRRVHHLGYFTDDLVRASAELEEQGFRRELSGPVEHGEITRAAFHYNPQAPGLWIELVAGEIAGEIGGWIADAAQEHGVVFNSPFELPTL